MIGGDHDKYSRNLGRIFVLISSGKQYYNVLCLTCVGHGRGTAFGIRIMLAFGARAGLLVRPLLLRCHLDSFPIIFRPLNLESSRGLPVKIIHEMTQRKKIG